MRMCTRKIKISIPLWNNCMKSHKQDKHSTDSETDFSLMGWLFCSGWKGESMLIVALFHSLPNTRRQISSSEKTISCSISYPSNKEIKLL